MSISRIILFLTLFSAMLFGSDVRVGVLPFKSNNIQHEYCEAITHRFQNALFSTNEFVLIEQDKLNNLLQEKGLKETGCLSPSCYIDFGELVGANRLLAGSVSLLDNVYTISVRMINVETGLIEKVATHDCKGSIQSILSNEIDVLAKQFAKMEKNLQNTDETNELIKKEPIAVLQFNANGIPNPIAIGLSDRIRSELFKTGMFSVIEREEMEEILQEQGFQQLGCADQSCVVEVGQLVGVKYMVGGNITKIGDATTISARIIDVSSGEIVRTATEDTEEPLELILKNTMHDLARGLSGLKLERRHNKLSRYTAISSIGLGVLGIGLRIGASRSYDEYLNEKYDPDKVVELRKNTELLDIFSHISIGVSATSALISTVSYFKNRRKIRIRDARITVKNSKKSQVYSMVLEGEF